MTSNEPSLNTGVRVPLKILHIENDATEIFVSKIELI